MPRPIHDPAKIKPGMYGHVSIGLKSKENALSVPIIALTAVKGENYIYVVRNSKIVKMKTELGLEDKYYIEILSQELKPDDQVVVQGKGLISEGLKVNAKLKKEDKRGVK